MRALALALALALAIAALAACEPYASADGGPSGGGDPFGATVVGFTPGEGAGHGSEKLPDVVLGPPRGKGATSGNVDGVLSLGHGGEIVLELGVDVVDAAGADLLVFENPFVAAGLVFGEPGEVAVSLDGEAWVAFPCAPSEPAPNGCAGYGVVYPADDATDPEEVGGDAFDLRDVGVQRARFIRLRDRGLSPAGEYGTAGFDLDAVAVVNGAP